MPDEVTPERVAMIAAAARVPITPEACARVARAVTPPVARLSATPVTLALETEPASFLVVLRQELRR